MTVPHNTKSHVRQLKERVQPGRNAALITPDDYNDLDNFGTLFVVAVGNVAFVPVGNELEFVAAEGVLTLTPSVPPDIADDDRVIINGVYYAFESDAIVDGIGTTGSPYRVDIGADDEGSLANLVKAINATGVAGTNYSLSLVAHPDVTAVATSAVVVTVTARVAGLDGNLITLAVANTTALAWDDTELTGGAADSILLTAVPANTRLDFVQVRRVLDATTATVLVAW